MPQVITHIVPQFFPAIDGIGDYALSLARCLRDRSGFDGRFLIGNPGWRGPANHAGFPVRSLSKRSGTTLVRELDELAEGGKVLLHYVGYGYQKRGVPLWLENGLCKWLVARKGSGARLITMFHELSSWEHVLQSAFFLAPLQRWLIKRIHHLSVRCATTTQNMLSRLNDIATGKTTLLPISSSLPLSTESASVPSGPLLSALIFGQTGTRSNTVRAHKNLLAELHRQDMLGSVVIVGKSARAASAGTPGSEDVALLREFLPVEKIVVLGELSPESAAEVFARVNFFLSFYPARFACKSSTFMSALAAGCPAVICDQDGSAPLEPGTHFLVCDGSPSGVERFLQEAASGAVARAGVAGKEWYLKNADWPVIATRFKEILGSAR